MANIHSKTEVGLTVEEAKSLIDSGYAWVRHDSLADKAHWGGGMLLGVEGSYGIVKPGLRHRKTERIPLSSIKPWKSKNADRMQRDGVCLREEEMKYAVVDIEHALIWAGSQKGFVKSLDHAILYNDIVHANKGIGGMKRSKRFADMADQDRIEIVPFEKAEALLFKWQPKEEPKKESLSNKETKKDEPIKANPVKVDEAPKPSLQKTGDPEVDRMMEEYRLSMNDLDEAQILVMEARERSMAAAEALGALAVRRAQEAMSASL